MTKDSESVKELGQRLLKALYKDGEIGICWSAEDCNYVVRDMPLAIESAKWIIEVTNIFRQLRPWYGEKPIPLASIKRVIYIKHTYDKQGKLEITRVGGRRNTIYFHYYYFDLDVLYSKFEEAREESIIKLEKETDDLASKLGKKLDVIEKIKELEF